MFILKNTVSRCHYQAEHIETGSLFRNKPYCDLNLFLERSAFLTKKLKELARWQRLIIWACPDYVIIWVHHYNHWAIIWHPRSMGNGICLIIVRAQGRPCLRIYIGFALDYPHGFIINLIAVRVKIQPRSKRRIKCKNIHKHTIDFSAARIW